MPTARFFLIYNGFQVLLALHYYASGNFCANVIYHKVFQITIFFYTVITTAEHTIHHLLFANGCTPLTCVLMWCSSQKGLFCSNVSMLYCKTSGKCHSGTPLSYECTWQGLLSTQEARAALGIMLSNLLHVSITQ